MAIKVVFTQRVAKIKITTEINPIKPLILSKICPSEAETLRIGWISKSGYCCCNCWANWSTWPWSFLTFSNTLVAKFSFSNQFCAKSRLTINILSVASPASTMALILNWCLSTEFRLNVSLSPTFKLSRSARVLPIMALRSSKFTPIGLPVICQ